MGAQSSSTVSEIFPQPIEHLHIKHLTQKPKIKNYIRYVDDILLIFNVNHTNIQAILKDINTLHLILYFTADIEQNNLIKYLDIFILKPHSNTKISIYRKITFTDTIIPHNKNMLQSDSYITDWTHTSYKTKNTTKKKTLFTISFTKLLPNLLTKT
jgi:hypothetical protein